MITRETARQRATLIQEVRSFFGDRGYLEVDTPALAPALIPEPHIEVFETRFRHPYGGGAGWNDGDARYLVPSPEIWMKELLARGFGNIYQLSHCFRNAESVGPVHSPEFTMLEWYTVDADYRDSIAVTGDLLHHLADALETRGFPHDSADLFKRPFLTMEMDRAFVEFAGFPEGSLSKPELVIQAARETGLTIDETRARKDPFREADELFQRVFLNRVEEQLPRNRPVVLTNYPAFAPTLARSDGHVAERWELYLGGLEVANCYTEERRANRLSAYLGDADRQKQGACVPHPTAAGLVEFDAAPPCSGVALGIDRLLMILTGSRDIRDVIFSTTFGIFREPNEAEEEDDQIRTNRKR